MFGLLVKLQRVKTGMEQPQESPYEFICSDVLVIRQLHLNLVLPYLLPLQPTYTNTSFNDLSFILGGWLTGETKASEIISHLRNL